MSGASQFLQFENQSIKGFATRRQVFLGEFLWFGGRLTGMGGRLPTRISGRGGTEYAAERNTSRIYRMDSFLLATCHLR